VCQRVLAVPTIEAASIQLAERAARKHATCLTEFVIDENAPLPGDESVEDAVVSGVWRRLWPVWVVAVALLSWFAFGAGRDFGLRRLASSPRQSLSNLRTVVGVLQWGSTASSRSTRNEKSFRDTLVVAVPAGRRVDQRIPSLAMISSRRTTPEFDAAVRALQLIGGDVSYTKPDGTFTLDVEIPARYRLLIVTSQHSDSDDVPRHDLAKVGQVFVPAYDLLAGKIYSLQEVHIDRNACLELTVP
jgi:hypothetical protein